MMPRWRADASSVGTAEKSSPQPRYGGSTTDLRLHSTVASGGNFVRCRERFPR
jgi:hypothetical protein